MKTTPLFHRIDPAFVLVALLVLFNLLAVLGAVAAGREARAAVRAGLALETRADARALEARLANERAQLDFLASSPPFSDLSRERSDDPVASRWARLDLEASLLLYLQSSAPVVRIVVAQGGEVLAAAQRLEGVPVLTTPRAPFREDPEWLRASWPLDSADAELSAWIDTTPLLEELGASLELHRTRPSTSSGPLERVTSEQWSPPLEGWLERTSSDARVLGAVERLADVYRTILILNAALLPVTLLLGALTTRRVRRLARLESERQQQERVQALELQIQHAERLASLGRFAAGTAHEINNPLGGMANYLELLRDDLEQGRADDARTWLPRLSEGIERVAGTVRQVLEFAEPGTASFEPIDLSRVIENTVAFASRHPECQDTRLEVDAAEDLELRGDPVGLGQLALNLVLNACQAQQPGGTVEVVARGSSDHVVLQVLDRGAGVPEELKERLFEPFQSGRGSSGLGLAVCHGIVSRHGGSIEALDRRPGPGTEIRVRLPRRPPGDSTAHPPGGPLQ